MNHTALGCDADIEIVVEDTAEQAAFNDTGVLGTGSNVRLRLTSHAHCYTAVFWKDVQGQVFNLISTTTNNNSSLEMSVGDVQIIPDRWLILDNKPGLETIYLISSETSLTDLSRIGLLLANHDPSEIKTKVSEQGLTVRWKTIEHSVDARIEKLLLPPRSQQVTLDQIPVEFDVIPRKPDVSPAHHARYLVKLSMIPKTSARGVSSSLIKQAGKSVVYIFTNEGMGSGVVVDPSAGLIVTSEHVVEYFDEVGIVFVTDPSSVIRDQRTYVADVLKTVSRHDLALLKLRSSPNSLSAFPLGRAEAINKGMPVHAIGHPRGLNWSYSTGYVSEVRHQFVWGDGRSADVIQTQTPISEGNSGGPLFTDSGELIGINTAGSEEGQGLNLSVSVTHVKELLGISVSDPPRDRLQSFSNPSLAKEYYDQDDNGTPDLFCFDSDRNGSPDICIVDEDEDGKVDFWKLDLNENRKFDGLIVISEDGYVWIFDRDEDGEPETIGYDLDSDGLPDEYRPYSG